jgi:hypothetical protein
VQIVENFETRRCSQFLGPGDNFFLQSYGAIFTDRAATGSGNLMDLMSTYNWLEPGIYFDLFHRFSVYLFKKGVA